jgi:hypothetical protein
MPFGQPRGRPTRMEDSERGRSIYVLLTSKYKCWNLNLSYIDYNLTENINPPDYYINYVLINKVYKARTRPRHASLQQESSGQYYSLKMKIPKNKGGIAAMSDAGSTSNSSAQNLSRVVDSGRFIEFSNYAIMTSAVVNTLKSTILIGPRQQVYLPSIWETSVGTSKKTLGFPRMTWFPYLSAPIRPVILFLHIYGKTTINLQNILLLGTRGS